jgi:nucleotide-binding universal stress UspA family protein
MPSIRTILCPIDFSETARHALDQAVALARRYGSKIVALHMSPRISSISPMLVPEVPVLPPEAPEVEAELRIWLAPAEQAGVGTQVVAADGAPAAGILERAAALPADLIVMGTHGRTGFEHLLLGSVTEKVLRKATCPVMTVPPPAATASTPPFKRILCPVDFSEPSLAAVRFAAALAEEGTARLTLLHVFEWPPDEALEELGSDVLDQFRRERETRTRERLDSLIRQDVRNWCTPEVRLRTGKAYSEIIQCAELDHDDLIVMGVHGRGPVGQFWFGSTTNQVVRQATCPVVTVRARTES